MDASEIDAFEIVEGDMTATDKAQVEIHTSYDDASEFNRFEELTTKLLSVSKAEVDELRARQGD